jgi:hypothetical protein
MGSSKNPLPTEMSNVITPQDSLRLKINYLVTELVTVRYWINLDNRSNAEQARFVVV